MATKSYSKHKEYKEFKSSGTPFAGEQFDMLKDFPKSKFGQTDSNGGHREYHYEYKEEKHPTGKYDRKDLRTVEEYSTPKSTPKKSESSSYFYEREERDLPSFNTSNRSYNYESAVASTPVYPKKSKVSDLHQNVDELDSLLDDLQKDQERQLYKGGYTSDTAESSSFDYRRGTAPSSGYSTLKKDSQLDTWGSSPVPAGSRLQEQFYREEKTSRTIPVPSPTVSKKITQEVYREEKHSTLAPPPPTVTRAAEMRQEMFREEKHESRVVPSQVSPALPQPVPVTTPAPACSHCHHVTSSQTGTLTRSSTPMNKVTTTVKTYTYEVPADDPAPVPVDTRYVRDERHVSHTRGSVPASPALGCTHCTHCSARLTHGPAPPVTTSYVSQTAAVDERTSERVLYAQPANEVRVIPSEPANGHGPYGPTSYKFSETLYSSHNTTERLPPAPAAAPAAPAAPALQRPPRDLNELMEDFPEARFPVSQTDGAARRVEVSTAARTVDKRPSANVAGPPVYYPPGHQPFAKEGYQASAMMAGGAHASGKGMYEYEAGAKSKEKHSETKTAVPVCLPLCCAMPCVIM